MSAFLTLSAIAAPAPATTDHLGSRGWRALATGVTLVATGALPGFLAAALAPRIRDDFPFSSSSLGVAAAVFYVVSMVLSTPLGRVVERIGAVAGLRASAGLTALVCLAVAALADSAAGLIAILGLAGVGNALASPAVSAALKHEIAPPRQGLAFGSQQAGASLGAFLAGLSLPAVAIPFGWRWAYVGVAAIALAAAAAAPRHIPRPTPGKRGRPPKGLGVVHAIGLTAFFASAASVGFISFLVTYSVEKGIDESEAGVLLAVVSLCAAISRIGLGAVADRAGQDALRPVPAMFLVSACAYLLLIVGEPVLIVVAALLAGSFGWAWPGALNLAVVQHSPQAPAWAVGVMLAGLFAGAVAGPLTLGVLGDAGHFTAGWVLCATFALLATVTVVAVRRAGYRS
jgi:predicted MFS family arabinose efflux permease